MLFACLAAPHVAHPLWFESQVEVPHSLLNRRLLQGELRYLKVLPPVEVMVFVCTAEICHICLTPLFCWGLSVLITIRHKGASLLQSGPTSDLGSEEVFVTQNM